MTDTLTLTRTTRFFQPARILIGCFAVVMFLASAAADDTSDEVAALILAAEKALEKQEYQVASGKYRQAADLSDDAEVAMQATRIGYSYGFNEDAIRAANRWATLAPDNDEAALYVAQLYLRSGEIRQSRKSFERLLKKGEQPVDERLLALIPVLSREDSGNAYELMRQLAKPYSDSAFAHYAVAVLALQAGDTDAAAARSLKAVEIDSEWVKPHLLYARSLLLSGKSDEAIDYTARLIGDDPDPDPEARLELAIMLVSAGRDDDALSQVNQILLEQPYRTDALRMMAIINFRLDHMDAAKADFEDLLQSGNYRMDALYYLGRIADMESDHTTAVRYYSQVVSGSNAVLSQSRVAGLLAQQGKDDKALEHLTRFAEANPSYAVDMLRAKAQLLVSMDRHDESLALFDQVVEYRPDNEGVQLGRAELLLRMDRLEDAISQYRLTLKRWPESAMSMNALGYTLADRTEEYEEAAKLIRKALDLTPDSAAIMDSWGWVLYRQGKAEEGLGFLMDAYQMFRDPEIAGHIVEVLWSLERHDEAKEALEDAELLFPDSEFLKEMRERYGPETP